jgi:MoaA/NifB/PqqE/SkfB family radical SAM enzyme
MRISIETTDACNLFCSACKSPHGTNFMSQERFETIASKLKKNVTHLGLHWRGEPCLHPRLPEIAESACDMGFKPWLSTNTAVPNLNDPDYVQRLLDNLDWVEFCVDGYDEPTVKAYRVGARWKTVKQNLETLRDIEAKCVKKMRVLMFRYNDGKEDVYREMAKKYRMNQLIFAAPLMGLQETFSKTHAQKWLPPTKKYQRYKNVGSEWRRVTGRCKPNPIVSVHGTVHPCCLDWELEHSLGNLETDSLNSIMAKYRRVAPTMGSQKMCELCCLPAQRVNFMEKII